MLSFNTLPTKEALEIPLNPQDQSRHTLTFGSCTVREQSVSFIVIMSSSFRANSFLLMGRFRTWGPNSQFLSSRPFPKYQTPTHRENHIQQTNYPEGSESWMTDKATWSISHLQLPAGRPLDMISLEIEPHMAMTNYLLRLDPRIISIVTGSLPV